MEGITGPGTVDQDAAVTAVNHPISGRLLGNAETVTVKIQNKGSQAISNVPVYYEINGRPAGSGSCTTPIPAGGEVAFSFPQTADLSTGRTSYFLKAYTELNGDKNPANDACSLSIDNYGDCRIGAFPYDEGFENALDFHCWTTYNKTGGSRWERRLGATDAREPRTGRYAMRIVNLSEEHQDHYLVSPKISLPASGICALSFGSKCNLVNSSGNNSLWITSGNAPDPDDPQAQYELLWSSPSVQEGAWVETTLLLEKYKGQDVYLAFRYQGGAWSHIWYLDDIRIVELPGRDLGVTAVHQPESNAGLTGNETVTIQIGNSGSQPVDNVPVYFQVNSGTVVNETITGTIAALKDTVYTFHAKADLSVEGDYLLKAGTALSGDENPANDEKTVSVSNYGECKISRFPYLQDFENRSSLNGWTVIYPGPRNVPDIEGADLGEAHSGEQFWRFISFYGNGSGDAYYEQFLITPELDDAEPKILEFYYRPDAPSGIHVQEFFSVGYSTTDTKPASFTWLSQVTANRREWVKHAEIIPSGAKYIAINYHKFNFFLNIDDVSIRIIPPSIDAGVTKIVSPVRGDSEPVPVTVTLKNFGGTPLTSLDIAYELLDNPPVVEHYEDATGIAPGMSLDYTFSDAHQADVSAFRDDYTLKAYVLVNGDLDNSNDTAAVHFLYRPNVRLYGYRYWDNLLYEQYEDAHHPVFFDSGDLSLVTEIGNYRDGLCDITAAEYVNDTIYAFSTDMGYPANFIRLTPDWTEISKTAAEALIWDMTYDYSTHTMYAIKGSQLVKVDLTTGALTTVAAVRRFYTLACNREGQLYGVDENGWFCSIDKRTGTTRQIGKTGLTLTSAHQSMTFDLVSGRLFWAMPWEGLKEDGRYDSQGRLCEIDPATGITTNLGSINGDGQARVAGLYIPYKSGDVNLKSPETDEFPAFSIYPNPSAGEIHIAPLPENATVRILNVFGQLLETHFQGNSATGLKLNLPQGMYFVQVEKNGKKVINKLIIK